MPYVTKWEKHEREREHVESVTDMVLLDISFITDAIFVK
jgi:hypothetical protein